MYEKLKEGIKEIIQITKECPEALQQKCFEVLLENFLQINQDTRCLNGNNQIEEDKSTGLILEEEKSPIVKKDSRITENDFHVKVKKFFQMNSINVDDLNKIYYMESDLLMPYYESMHSTKMSECQIRLTLLSAFENGFSTGELSVKGEDVRKRCAELKCYDAPNFTSIFKNNCIIFDNWSDKYDKNTTYIISAEGKKMLAQTINKLILEY